MELQAELARVLGGRTPTLTDVPHLPFARSVIDEALRLYPPFFVIARDAIADTELGGVALPKGTTLFLSPVGDAAAERKVLRRSCRSSGQSDGRDGLASRLHRFAYFPFSNGPRVCRRAGALR